MKLDLQIKLGRNKTFPHALRKLDCEIVVDSFCGGGGTSLGLSWWMGREPHVAVNHNDSAIAMHKVNHPRTLHYREDVFGVNPQRAIGNLGVAFAWFSPDCRHFSNAAGKVPKSKDIRGLAWSVLPWAALPLLQRPRVIALENVPEWMHWGPLDENGQPDKTRRGETCKAFISALSTGLQADHPALEEIMDTLGPSFDKQAIIDGLGYEVDVKIMLAADHGTPTRRRRLFLVARCDGLPITWPAPTHGPIKSKGVREGRLLPYKTTGDHVIDWTIPAQSIFTRTKGRFIGGRNAHGGVLSLADNTLSRIAKGFVRLVENNPEPYIVRIGQTGFGGSGMSYSIHDPLTTITSKAEHCLCAPVLTHLRGTCKDGVSLKDPAPTITAGGNHLAVSAAFMVKFYGTSTAASISDPLHTITAKDRHGLAQSEFSLAKELTDELRLQAWHCARFVDDYGRDHEGRDGMSHLAPPRTQYLISGNHVVVDFTFRMLTPRELFRANGFPDDYIIEFDQAGNSISKADQVARCGNAVPPQFSYAIASAMLPSFTPPRYVMAA